MNKPTTANNPLTLAIEHRIIKSGKSGLPSSVLMQELKIGRTCARNHLKVLEEQGRIYSEKHRGRHANGAPWIYLLYRASDRTPAVKKARRDWLVEAFFGPA